MAELQKILEQVSDDYLIGMTNKGIVKRAYKDKEETRVEIEGSYSQEQEEVTLRVGEETIVIRSPLSESSCSCPSRSICRHIILGIIWLKEQKPVSVDEGAEEEKSVPKIDEILQKEIADYPVEALRKKIGKRYPQFLKKMETKKIPEVTYANVYTVVLEEKTKVTLLSPIDYSTCSCHKKELCEHKAEAILWCKFLKGMIKEEDLQMTLETAQLEEEDIRRTADVLKRFLTELITTGLSRTSEDRLEYLERLAVQAHSANLANMEREIRELSEYYRQYFKKKASFHQKELLDRLLKQYVKCEQLLQADVTRLAELAGQFKADYYEAGTLHLCGVAGEKFRTKSGYYGETVYFLETDTNEWYTYTISRPIMNDRSGKRGVTDKYAMPWGIPLSIGESTDLQFSLFNARCDERNRLSSSMESKAEIIKKEKFAPDEDCRWFFDDFGRLFSCIPQKEQWLYTARRTETPKYVFLQPEVTDTPYFDEVQQTLYITLYDQAGKEVILELPYSTKDEWNIYKLENIMPEDPPCFFGEIYLKKGRIHFRPVTIFDAVYTRQIGNDIQFVQNQDAGKIPERFLELILDGYEILEEVFQSGFTMIGTDTFEKTEAYRKRTEQYGLKKLSAYMKQMHSLLQERKHQTAHTGQYDEQIVSLLARAQEYLYLCREKAAYDQAKEYYREFESDINNRNQ